MDIYIDRRRIKREIDKIVGLFAGRDQLFISLHNSLMEIGMLHETTVHEKVLQRPPLLSRIGTAYETGNSNQRALCIHRKQFLVQVFAIYIDDTLAQTWLRQIKYFRIIMVQYQTNLRIDQRDPFEFVDNITKLRLIRFQEFTAGWYIKK